MGGRFTFGIALTCMLACAGSSAIAAAGGSSGIEIQTNDVTRFYKIYDAAHGHPTAEQLQTEYVDRGSPGLQLLAKTRYLSGAHIAKSIETHPELYVNARTCMAALPRVRARLNRVFAKLVALYPQAQKPPVTIVVGWGKPLATSAPGDGVQVGIAAMCGPAAARFLDPDVDGRFVHVIAHEYIHAQQPLADDDRPTVLERSLLEGAAEFMGEMISGKTAYGAMRSSTAGREAQIERKFVANEDKTDLSDWVDNTTADKLGDLGYWVGYRIVKSYYEHRADKRQAIRDIIGMKHPHAFLATSGWYPGIVLKHRAKPPSRVTAR